LAVSSSRYPHRVLARHGARRQQDHRRIAQPHPGVELLHPDIASLQVGLVGERLEAGCGADRRAQVVKENLRGGLFSGMCAVADEDPAGAHRHETSLASDAPIEPPGSAPGCQRAGPSNGSAFAASAGWHGLTK
jgi:hypothetical protein